MCSVTVRDLEFRFNESEGLRVRFQYGFLSGLLQRSLEGAGAWLKEFRV